MRSGGMNDAELQVTSRAVVVAKLMFLVLGGQGKGHYGQNVKIVFLCK